MLVRFAPKSHTIVPRSGGRGTAEPAISPQRDSSVLQNGGGWSSWEGFKNWQGVCTSPFSSVRWECGRGQRVDAVTGLRRFSSQTSGIARAEIAQLQ